MSGECARTGSGDEHKSEDLVFLAAGTVMILSEILKQTALFLFYGAYQWWYFPWQLCSVPMYICILIYACSAAGCRFDGLRGALINFLADFTLLSGIASFFDTSGFNYELALLTVHSYVWHAALIILGIYAGTRKRASALKDFIPALFIYLFSALIAELINLSFDSFGTINMFYINPHYYMGQIVFRDLTSFIPNSLVICLYIAVTAAGGFIFHVMWNRLSVIFYFPAS